MALRDPFFPVIDVAIKALFILDKDSFFISYDDGELSHATLKKKRGKGLVGSHVKADTT